MTTDRKRTLAAGVFYVITFVAIPALLLIGPVLVTLRQSIGGPDAADASTLVTTGRSLVAVRDVTFLLGPGVVPALNALLLAPILYRARLVPRILPIVGLIGVPLLLASSAATLFGTNGQISALSFVLGLPIAVWEFALGIWMIVKAFSTAAPVDVRRSSGTTADAGHSSVVPA